MKKEQPCPCGSGRTYPQCCARLHEGLPAPDPQSLMRARYSANALKLGGYLATSWHPDTRPADAAMPDANVKWIGLEILHHSQDGDEGIVEFVARYRIAGRGGRLHERSRFRRQDGHWYYLDGLIQ